MAPARRPVALTEVTYVRNCEPEAAIPHTGPPSRAELQAVGRNSAHLLPPRVPTSDRRTADQGGLAQRTADQGRWAQGTAGCCWVMQCTPPPLRKIARASTSTIWREGNSSSNVWRARWSATGSPNVHMTSPSLTKEKLT